MGLGLLTLIMKLVVLFSALAALGFAIGLLFFYEHFQAFNESANVSYFTKNKGYKPGGGGGGYLFDNWVTGWHTGFGIIALIIAIWLFWVFFSYLKL